jgi:STE24 endopeptidase
MFTVVFLLALLVSVALRIWLALRQSRHVASHHDVVPFEFTAGISLTEHRKAADYTQAKIRVALAALTAETALLLVLTLGGLLQRLAEFWLSILGQTSFTYGLSLFASVGAIGFVVDLPFGLYRIFVIETHFGFNKMTVPLFLADLAKQTVLAVLIGGPVLLAVLWLMVATGEQWWLYVWLFWLGFNLLAMLLYPTLIAPLFNKFSPLPDGALKNRIQDLLARCGFTSSGLFVMDGSKRSAHGNAYFTGFGKAKRIVFFDTLIEKLTPAQVVAVLAHELGHFRLRHVWKRIGLMAIVSLAVLWLLGTLIDEPWFYQGLGVVTPETAMALILFAQVLPIFLFPLTPVASGLSRRYEYEADAYAARRVDAGDLVAALVELYRDNATTLTPDPLHSLFYDSHPPASLRVARLRQGGRSPS